MNKTFKDFRDAALAMLPKGPAWNRNKKSKTAAFFSAVGDVIATLVKDVENLATELIITTTEQLLPEWEADYGLPSPFNSDTIVARRAALAAKAKKKQVTTDTYIKEFAAALGYDLIVVSYHKPFQCGVPTSQCGNGTHEVGCIRSSNAITAVHSRGIVPQEYFEMEMKRILSAHVEINFLYQ